jgi:hypothetical protein
MLKSLVVQSAVLATYTEAKVKTNRIKAKSARSCFVMFAVCVCVCVCVGVFGRGIVFIQHNAHTYTANTA